MTVNMDEFKRILLSLKEKNINLKVRTHTGWSQNFLHIIGFIASNEDQVNRNFRGVVLSNMNETEGILINNISTVSAFVLEQPCQQFQADQVYTLLDNQTFKALILH